jgi:CubicO group peptidase (beta-lactamase class C family)
MTAARAVLERHVDAAVAGGQVGIVAGALVDGEFTAHGGGARSVGGPTPDAHTIFRIGSVSKVVTAAALALAVRAGDVALDEPVAAYLPGWFRLPTYDGNPILVRQLATHSSGLPRGVADPAGGVSVRTLAASPGRRRAAVLPRDQLGIFEYRIRGARCNARFRGGCGFRRTRG